jgi:hypothetical protein
MFVHDALGGPNRSDDRNEHVALLERFLHVRDEIDSRDIAVDVPEYVTLAESMAQVVIDSPSDGLGVFTSITHEEGHGALDGISSSTQSP